MMMSEDAFYEFEIKNLSFDDTKYCIQNLIKHIYDLEEIVKNNNNIDLMEPSYDLQLSSNIKFLCYSMSRIIFENINTEEVFSFEDWFKQFNIPTKFRNDIIEYATNNFKCFKKIDTNNKYKKISNKIK